MQCQYTWYSGILHASGICACSAFSSCRQTTSGWSRASHSQSCAARARMPFTFQVAIFMKPIRGQDRNHSGPGPEYIVVLTPNYEPLTTLSWLSTPLTPSTLPAICAARRRCWSLSTVPQRLTLPSAAVTSMAAAWSLAVGASSACFTLAASSLFGSGFGGSGAGCGCGATATGAGGGGVGCAAGLGGGGDSEQAMSAAARPRATMCFMLTPSSGEL